MLTQFPLSFDIVKIYIYEYIYVICIIIYSMTLVPSTLVQSKTEIIRFAKNALGAMCPGISEVITIRLLPVTYLNICIKMKLFDYV